MKLLDSIYMPSGRERVTQRPVWRIRTDQGEVRWAYLEERDGQIWIAGAPTHPVDVVVSPPDPTAGAIVGAGAGALVGASLGGPAGAIIGGIVGLLLGAGNKSTSRA